MDPIERTIILAEIANAHGGDVETANALIDAAKHAGVDGVKFQRFSADELVVPGHPKQAHFRKLELSDAQWRALVGRARAHGLLVFSDVFGERSARAMQALDVDGFKIHASDTMNFGLLRIVGAYRRPVLLGCGGTTLLEIREAVDCLRQYGCPDVILMHGFQAFPTALEETHLGRLVLLRAQLGLPVGLMDHVAGDSEWAGLVPLLGVALGARIIEKHVTLDRASRGIDHCSALEPTELAQLVQRVRQAEQARGPAAVAFGLQEIRYRQQMKKQLVTTRPLPAGAVLREDDLTSLRSNMAVAPLRMAHAAGRRTVRAMAAYEPLTLADLEVRVAILVIARLHSTRLPRKALIPIAGRPALWHLIERARLSRQASEVVVCTSAHPDDDPIAALAEDAGVRCVRGSEDDVLARMIQAAQTVGAQIVVRATGDDILLDPEHLDRAVAWHRSHNADYTTMAGLPSGTECEVFSVWALETAHRLAEDPSRTEYLSWYMNRPDLFELANLEAEGDVRRPYRLTLDTLEDLRVVQAALEAVYRAERPYTLRELLAWLDAHPEIAGLNAQVGSKLTREQVNTRLRVG